MGVHFITPKDNGSIGWVQMEWKGLLIKITTTSFTEHLKMERYTNRRTGEPQGLT